MLRTPPHPATSEPTADRTERLLAAVRVALVAALTALVLAIAALAYAVARPQLPAPDHPAAAGNGSRPHRDSRIRVRELVARERATGIRLHARDVAAAAGISERRAYELLRAVRAEDQP